MLQLARLELSLQSGKMAVAGVAKCTRSKKIDTPCATIKAESECQFGKWLLGPELSAADKQMEQYRTLRSLHAEFREEAAKVAQLAIAGQKQAAEAAMDVSSSFNSVSVALINALTQWGVK